MGAELAPHVVAVEVANLSEGRLEVLVLVDADGWEQGVAAGVSWKISREKEKPVPVAGTEEIARFSGGEGGTHVQCS